MAKRKGIMLPAPYDGAEVRRWLAECGHVMVQPKLDGIHARWTGRELLSSQGNLITGVPHIVAELAERLPGVALEGEAYCHGWSGAKTAGVCRRKEPDQLTAYEHVELVIFDIIDPAATFQERLNALRALPEGLYYRTIDTERVGSAAAIEDLLADLLAQGYEGVVVKHPRRRWTEGRAPAHLLKWKPTRTDTYKLIECLEGNGDGKHAGTLGAMLVEDSDGARFKVGSFSLTDAERAAVWSLRERLAGEPVEIFYRTPDEANRSAGTFRLFLNQAAQRMVRQTAAERRFA